MKIKKMKQIALMTVAAAVFCTLCASCGGGGAKTEAASVKSAPVPAGMNKVSLNIVVEDKRPAEAVRRGFGSGASEHPEYFFNRTIDVPSAAAEHLRKQQLFGTVKTVPRKAAGDYTLKMIWLSSRTHLNGWIPFVLRIQNHLDFDMVLCDPDGKTLWTYSFKGQTVNTPTSFRWAPAQPVDLFQKRLLQKHLDDAMAALCAKAGATPGFFK